MTLGNMRELGVHHLIADCLNDAYRHQAVIDVSRAHFAAPRKQTGQSGDNWCDILS
jgi:hypothetical protein